MIDLDKPPQRQAPPPQGMPPAGMAPGMPPGSQGGQPGARPQTPMPMPGAEQPPPQRPQQQPGPPQQQQQVPPVVAQFQVEAARLGELNSIITEQTERLASLKRYLAQKQGGGGGQYANAVQQAPQGPQTVQG